MILGGEGITLDDIIVGTIFKISEFDFLRFYDENVAYGKVSDDKFSTRGSYEMHKRVFNVKDSVISLGMKSYIEGAKIEGKGLVQVGNFSSISWDNVFELALEAGHIYNYVSSYGMHFDWIVYRNFYPAQKFNYARLNIGSDVWIGRGCRLKVSNNDKPLNIGNGAIIASDSVVVKDVPPYAIVGGNPSKFIKWRFDREIIDTLERIKWWNWDIEKIYDNFHLFNNPVEFAKKFDPLR